MENERTCSTKQMYERADVIGEILGADGLADLLGLDVRPSGGGLRGPCPAHGGDNQSALLLRDYDDGLHIKCYTRCGRMNILTFVSRVTGKSVREAYEWLSGLIDDQTLLNALRFEKRDVRSFNTAMASINTARQRQEECSPMLCDHFVEQCSRRMNEYFIKRGFNRDLLEKFEVGYCPAYDSPWWWTDSPARVVIPIRDVDGTLLGISGRTIADHSRQGKYVTLSGSAHKETLYNLRFNRDAVLRERKICLVEGFCDVWAGLQFGCEIINGTMGTALTSAQITAILSLTDEVMMIGDNNKAGKEAVERIGRQLDGMVRFKSVYPESGDVGDIKSPEEFWNLMSSLGYGPENKREKAY